MMYQAFELDTTITTSHATHRCVVFLPQRLRSEGYVKMALQKSVFFLAGGASQDMNAKSSRQQVQ